MATRDWFCEDVLSGKIEIEKIWEDDLVLQAQLTQPAEEIAVQPALLAHDD